MSKTSDKGDLTELAKDIEQVFRDHGFEEPAFAVSFNLPEDRRNVHWVTNMRRNDGIRLLAATAQKMQSEVN